MWYAVRGHGARVPEPALPGRSPFPRARTGLSSVVRGAVVLMLALTVSANAQRPFEHVRHEEVTCTTCHGSGDEHRTLLVRSAQDCAACHHSVTRGLDCTRCHSPTALPQARTVVQTVNIEAAAGTRELLLPFAHSVHTGESCRSCHDTGSILAVSRSCASCHEHHRPEADCVRCHGTEVRTAHRSDAHLSCSTAGCHAGQRLPPIDASRSLCTMCHLAQQDHEPGGACAACHQVPRARERR